MDFDDFGFPPAEPPPGPPAPPSDLPPLQGPPERQQQSAPAPLVMPPRAPSPHVARAKAGLGVIVAAAAAGIGGVLGGPVGALGGLVGIGAARNLYRSQGIASTDPAERADAARSLALGVIGVAIVGLAGYKLYTSSKESNA